MKHYLTHLEKVEAFRMWNNGKDTQQISEKLDTKESVIYNKLPHIRESFRQVAKKTGVFPDRALDREAIDLVDA
jgi:hypothetical protein